MVTTAEPQYIFYNVCLLLQFLDLSTNILVRCLIFPVLWFPLLSSIPSINLSKDIFLSHPDSSHTFSASEQLKHITYHVTSFVDILAFAKETIFLSISRYSIFSCAYLLWLFNHWFSCSISQFCFHTSNQWEAHRPMFLDTHIPILPRISLNISQKRRKFSHKFWISWNADIIAESFKLWIHF